MKTLPLKLRVVERWWWCGIFVIYFLSMNGFCVSQNFGAYPPDSENNLRNRALGFQPDQRNHQNKPGPHLIAGAVPFPLPTVGEQFALSGHSGIAQNFVRIDSNHGRRGRNGSSANLGFTTGGPYSNAQNNFNKPHLQINMGLARGKNDSLKYIRISNQGSQDEFVQMTVLDSKGNSMRIIPSQFPLGVGVTAEIPFAMPSISQRNFARSSSSPGSNTNTPNPTDSTLKFASSDMITVLARGKRDTVQRSFVFGDPYDGGNYNIEPFCIDKDVTGTCRYRDDPVDCFRWEWTAYATILNTFGPDFKITSLPEGLFVSPGEHGRVRVYLKFSCCTPVVQFILTDILSHSAVKSCVVDVRELQHLHPGEIAGIVVGVVLLILIIIAVIIICARRRRKETINNVGMLPRLRSKTRSTKNDMEVITRQ